MAMESAIIPESEAEVEEDESSALSDRDERIAKATGMITIWIKVPDEEPRHREFSRQLLVRHCEYFFKHFCDPISGQIEVMTDFDPTVVDLFLDIIEDWDDYKNTLKNKINPGNFREINKIAVALNVGKLKEACDQLLMDTINSNRSLEDDETKRFLVEESFFIARTAKFVDDDSITHLKYVEQLFQKLKKKDNTTFLKAFMMDYDRFSFDELDLLLKISSGRKPFYEIISNEAESGKEIDFRKTKFLLDKLGLRSLWDHDKDLLLLSNIVRHLSKLRHLTNEDHQYLPNTLVNAQKPNKIWFYRTVFPKTSKYRFDGSRSPYVSGLLWRISSQR